MDRALCHLWSCWLYLNYSSACFFPLAGLSQWTHFQRQRNKAKPHNAPWLLFSMLLFVSAFSIVVMKTYGLESVLRAESQAHRHYYNQAVSLLAHMLPLNFATNPPLWRPFTFISSKSHNMPKPAMREYDPIAEVANKLYSRTEIELRPGV